MEGSDDTGVSKICLFVRNLPYSATDADLEALFKVHGPLKSCYTVKEKGILQYYYNAVAEVLRFCLYSSHKELFYFYLNRIN